MIRSRSRGLYNLHALIILFVLPTFFVFATSWAVVFLSGTRMILLITLFIWWG